jgi:hypothetical protein
VQRAGNFSGDSSFYCTAGYSGKQGGSMKWQRQLSSYSRRAFAFVKHNQIRTLLLVVACLLL